MLLLAAVSVVLLPVPVMVVAAEVGGGTEAAETTAEAVGVDRDEEAEDELKDGREACDTAGDGRGEATAEAKTEVEEEEEEEEEE